MSYSANQTSGKTCFALHRSGCAIAPQSVCCSQAHYLANCLIMFVQASLLLPKTTNDGKLTPLRAHGNTVCLVLV